MHTASIFLYGLFNLVWGFECVLFSECVFLYYIFVYDNVCKC